MANRKKKIYALLDAIYAQIPAVECTGACVKDDDPCCGTIAIAKAERERIAERVGWDRLKPNPQDPTLCPLFDLRTRRCTVYDIRPGVCRIWGTTDPGVPQLHCRWGCKPKGGYIDRFRTYALMRAIFKAGGKVVVLGRLMAEVMEAWQTHDQRKRDAGIEDTPNLGGSLTKAIKRYEAEHR